MDTFGNSDYHTVFMGFFLLTFLAFGKLIIYLALSHLYSTSTFLQIWVILRDTNGGYGIQRGVSPWDCVM